ncbi:MAG: antitoxin VapB family protein [Methanomicrobium sp.]|nr:antitoxin VapB family protein [Methanomicrobium sp.]
MSSMVRIQEDVKQKLDSLKAYPKESYSDIISRIADSYGAEILTDEDIADIEKSLEDLKSKKYKTIEQYANEKGISLS